MRPRDLVAIATVAVVLAVTQDARAAEGAGKRENPCEGRPKRFQAYEGVCLPDRLVGYIKCVIALGGNQLRVTKDESNGSDSHVRVDVAGAAKGVLISGSGRVSVDRKRVDADIKKLDITYGDKATTSCLLAAGIRSPPPRKRGSPPVPPQSPTNESNSPAPSADMQLGVRMGGGCPISRARVEEIVAAYARTHDAKTPAVVGEPGPGRCNPRIYFGPEELRVLASGFMKAINDRIGPSTADMKPAYDPYPHGGIEIDFTSRPDRRSR